MIKTLEQLALEDRERFGDKSVALAEFIHDIDEQGFKVVRPFGYASDIGDIDEAELRHAFEDLRARINTSLDNRIVGALILRSSGYMEKSGANDSIPVLYDANDVERSWQRFRDAFYKVRFNPSRDGDKVKGVLMQVFHGELTYADLGYRRLGSFAWPKWPDWEKPDKKQWADIMRPIYQPVREAMKEAGLKFGKEVIIFSLQNGQGQEINSLQFKSKRELSMEISGIYSHLYYGDDATGLKLDNEGRVLKGEQVVLDIGDSVNICLYDMPSNPVIGRNNEAFVARSHDYTDADKSSIRVALGSTSYLVKGLLTKKKRGMRIYLHNPNGDRVEEIDLGRDFSKSAVSADYVQPHIEAFSIQQGRIVAVEHRDFRFAPYVAQGWIAREILKIANLYSQKRGMPVELEGAYISGKLHIWQITNSPLPSEIIPALTKVPQSDVIYACGYGRGAVSYRGDLVIGNVNDPDRMVIGFDRNVTGNSRFLHLVQYDAFENVAGRTLVLYETHLVGYACQVTFEASHQGKQGGVFYPESIDGFLSAVKSFAEQREGVLVLRDVCVEACKQGMQIYKKK